jgi:clan AA aspartic protease (TIGR02281 family)
MRKLMRNALLCFVLFGLVVLPRAARSDDSTTSGPLKDKGLVKVGILYVLPAETDDVTAMRTLRQLRRKIDDENRQRAQLDDKVKMANNMMAQWEFDRRGLNEKLGTSGDPTIQNQIIAKINDLTSKLNEGQKFKDENEAKLHAMGAEDRANYITQVVDLSAKVEAVQKSYADLAADPDVKTALDNAKPKGRLGPTSDFISVANQLKKWRGDISSDSVPIDMQGSVPMVEVTLNGKLTQSMVVDSGASLIALPASMAKQLGMVPGPNDPILRLQMGDGKLVEAKKMVLDSVRVGTFTVEKVDCAVLPESFIAAEPLLGGTFLNNFIYKVDTDAGKLHLAELNAGGTKKRLGDAPAATPKADSN